MTKHLWLPLAAAALTAGTASAQRPLVPGQITRGSLSSSDPRSERGAYYDAYTFQGRRGETVIVQMESRDLDAYLHLGTARRGTWRELAYDDDGGDGRNSRIQLTLPEDGTYVVRASSLGRSTGQYTLTLSNGGDYGGDDDPTPVETVRPRRRDRDGYVRAGERIQDHLSSSDPTLDGGEPFHLYTYAGQRGERITITLRSTEFDSYLVLGTAGGRHGVGNALARDDDGGGHRDSRIVFTLPEARDYVIRVNPLGAGTGAYTLEVESDRRGGYDRPGRDDYDSGYDGGAGLDRRLVGRWGLVVPGVRVDTQSWPSISANAGFGYLDVARDGSYTLSRNGRTRRGWLQPFTPRGNAAPNVRYYRVTDGREEFYVSFTAYRGERYMQVNSVATGQVVAYGYVDPASR